MTATRLLILGAVRERGSAHGYQVRRDLESWGVHLWGTIRQGSIYHGLRKLEGEGLLEVVPTTAPAAGPTRTSYGLTEDGERAFVELLEDALRSDEAGLAETIAGVGFITELTRERAIELLRLRVDAYRRRRARVVDEYDRTADEDWGHHVEAVRLWARTADSAVEWTQELVERLQDGAYTMRGETRGETRGAAAGRSVTPAGTPSRGR
ncbi:PadR family transcriptional regulator [Isoptericola cucumis]|uniref:PadR family transcriptional regulator n=1 Tax=Isoptericola cucumis TaxID=1776856 RepID=UPI003208F1D8